MNNNWLKELEKDLMGASATNKYSRYAPKSENNLSLPIFLLCLLVAVGAAVWYSKQNTNTMKPNFDTPIKLQQENRLPINPPTNIPISPPINSSLEKDIEWCKNRLALLASITNNNFAVYEKYHKDPNYVYLNKDWSIDQMPKNLDLTDPSDKEFIEQFLRKIKEQ